VRYVLGPNRLAVTLLALACTVVAAQAQMPDPRMMSGQVIPTGDLPTGSVTVRVIRQTMANAVAGVGVELHGAGDVRHAVTGAQGRAQFDGLPVGARVHVVAIVDGERLESIEFPVPPAGGIRTLLAAGVGAGTSTGAAPVAPDVSEGQKSRLHKESELVLGADTRFAFEFQDDTLTAFYLLEIVNPEAAPLSIASPLVIDLPSSATGTAVMPGGSPLATASGPRVTIMGPFPPGVTQVPVAFRIESWGERWRLEQRFPLAIENVAVAAQKLRGMTLESPQATTVREAAFQGMPYLVATGGRVDPNQPLTLILNGLPHRSSTPLYVTLAIAIAVLCWGVWTASNAVQPKDAQRRRDLESRRERGLATLAAVDDQRRAGLIDDGPYAEKRAAVVFELERIYRELDAMGDLPGGDQGLAA
jgi:hypothetical protein